MVIGSLYRAISRVVVLSYLLSDVKSNDILKAPRLLSDLESSESLARTGQTKILQCNAFGQPQPIYQWVKNWQPLGNYSSEHFLRVTDISLDDVGNYRCLAKNDVGTVVSPRISLKVAYMNYNEENVEMLKTNSIIKVSSGDSVVLHLPPGNSYPSPTVTWHSDSNNILFDIHYVITEPGSSLVILDAGKSEEQMYWAVITNTHLGQEFNGPEIQIVVENENSINEMMPSFVITPTNVTVLEGTSKTQLQCIVNARPIFELETLWFKGDTPIERSNMKYYLNRHWNRTLTFLDISIVHSGLYKCVSRLKGSLEDPLVGEIYVNVEASPSLTNSLPEVIEVDSNKEVSLNCPARGFPEPIINWFWNGVNVTEADENSIRFEISSNGTLYISPIYQNDTGIFQCIASNPLGEASTYTWLKIRTSAPVMTVMPSNETAVEGQSLVRMSCQATGAPQPNSTWFLNDKKLKKTEGIYEVTEEGDLLIKDVTRKEEGKYTCLRQNEAGQVEGHSWLNVLVKTKITKPPIDTSVVLGHVAILNCNFIKASSIDARINWYHDGLKLGSQSPHINIRKDGTIVIEQVRATDAGQYKCEILSSGGNDTHTATLKVMDLPYPPKLVIAEREQSLPKSAKVSWTKNFDGNSPVTKFIVFKREVPPTGIEADLGLNWEVALSNVSSSSSSAIISELRPSTGYQFKIAAVNNVGEGPPSEPSEILVLPQEAPSGPPQGLVGSSRSNSEIMIQWEAPPEEEINGVLRGYIVRYRLWGYKDSQWYLSNITKATQHNYLIGGLITWKDYEIQVAAYNAKGIGVYTQGIKVKTKEGIPLAPPRDVSIEVISSTSIRVGWKPPQPWMINGINQGYKVEVWRGKPGNSTAAEVSKKVAPSPYPDAQETVVLEGLSKFTNYFVTVLCFTHPGDGKRSKPIAVKTLEDAPNEVENLRFTDISDRSLRVMWSPPNYQNGILKGYTLTYHQNNTTHANPVPFIYNLTADVTSFFVDNLTASTYYTFTVYAWTSVGPGKQVSTTIQSSVEPVKPEPPTRLAVSNIQPFSVVLQFTPGFDGNASIDSWRVQARTFRSSTWETIYETSAPLANTLTVKHLIPYTTYSLRVVAVNVVGESQPSRPSPEFQTLQAEPSHPPHNMTLRAISPSEIRVRWIPLQQQEWYGAPHGYLIKYRAIGCGCSFRQSKVRSITANSYQLELLEEYTAYEVKMVAINDVGSSNETALAIERTRESVPTAGPSNVTAIATSSTTIVVEWNSVPQQEQNGILEGYKVVYSGRNLKPEEKIIESNFTFSTTLTQLRKFYHYTIQVKAFTRLGDGALSTPYITVQTLEDVPGPPSDVSFPDVTFTYARVIWEEPKEPNGIITAYDVTYYLTDNQEHNYTIQFGPKDRSYRAENLKPESNYLFLVRARTRLGWGHVLRAPVYTTNNRELPAPPSQPRVSASQITSSSILFTWNPGRDGFAPIRYYLVQFAEGENNWHDVSEKIDYSSTSYVVKGLKPFTTYKFRIKAVNDIGHSEWSRESEYARTKPASPSFPPTNVKVIPITRTSIQVEWIPLPLDAWNGDTETGGYRIKYRQISNVVTPYNIQLKEVLNISANKIELNTLQRDTNYEIIVMAFNQQGESASSSPHTVYVGEAVPTGNPLNVKGKAISPTEIKIEWEPPSEKERNGELLGYKIFYRNSKNATLNRDSTILEEEEEEVVDSKTTSFELLYLDMYTEYIITLLCFNPAGEGPRSPPILVRTKESLPGAVANLGFSEITMSSLKVIWDPPQKPNGHIVGYLVTYETALPDENFSKQVTQKVTLPYLLVHSLKEEVTYRFGVKAETIGYGPKVEANVTTGPQLGSPSRPKDVHLSQTVSSITLHWRNNHPGNGPILGYYIEAKKQGSDSWLILMKTDTGEIEEYTVSFQNLLPSTSYAFRLIVYNKFGISYPSMADQKIVTPTKVFMEQGYLQQQPFYHRTWFMVSLAAASVVIIIIVIAILCVQSKTYKYKQKASNKTLEESLGTEETIFSSFEMTHRGAISKRGTLGRNTLGSRHSAGQASTGIVSAKTPPRPSPASVTYSDDDTIKGYDEDLDDDSSDVTEKPTDISSTDSQNTDSACDDENGEDERSGMKQIEASSASATGGAAAPSSSSFVSHYANVNDALRQSWRRQKPFKNYSNYTDSEAEGSAVMSLNGGHIIMNNMAGSRAPLPGFSSFV